MIVVFPNVQAIVDLVPAFKPGDPRPKGYMAFFEWAEVQHKAGLKQVQCGKCNRWNFPQELSGETVQVVIRKAKYHRRATLPVCLKCVKSGGANAAQ